MEEIYVNVDYGKQRAAKSDAGPTRSSERRFHVAVVLCLGLLCVLLLAGLIGLSVHYHDSMWRSAAELSTIRDNLTERLQASEYKFVSLTEERDLLNASLTEMTKARDLLNANLTEMTKELTRLKHACPAGWRMFACACYYLSHESGSWEKGREDCRDSGADLVIIDSAEEQMFLSGLNEQETWAWIGLTDKEEEGTWTWIDGSPLSLSYWIPRQPDNGNGDPRWGEEDCGQIRVGKKTIKDWNDRSCDASLRWICEKKLRVAQCHTQTLSEGSEAGGLLRKL